MADGSVAIAPQPSVIAEPSVVAGREHVLRFTYDALYQPVRVVEEGFDPVDGNGAPDAAVHAISRTTEYRYARIGTRVLLSEIDGPLANGPKGTPEDSDITRLEYDERGDFPTAIVSPGGLRETFRHDALTGRLREQVGADGIATRFDYDADGQLVATERAGYRITRGYDAMGRVARISDGPGREITLRYDAAGRTLSVTDAQGHKAESVFDTEGGVQRYGLYDPGQAAPLRATYRWYDDHRRLVRELSPDGSIDTWHYDEQGRAVEHVDGEDVLHLDSRNPASGARLHLDRAPDGLMRVQLSTPRGVGDAGSMKLPASRGAVNRQDDFGRVVASVLPGQGVRRWMYDAAGRVLTLRELDRSAQLADSGDFHYDVAGRLVRRVMKDAQGRALQTLERDYEGARLVRESNEAESRQFSYDAAGRISATVVVLKDEQGRPAFSTTLRTRFDARGGAVERTLADGSTMHVEQAADTGVARAVFLRSARWSHFGDGLARWLPASWTTVVQGWLPRQAIVADIGFHPYDGITGFTAGNGLVTHKQFDIAGRVTALKTSGGAHDAGSGVVDETLHYGAGSRVRGIDGAAPTLASLQYEGFGALVTPTSARAIKTSLAQGDVATGAYASASADARGRVDSDGRLRYAYTVDAQVASVTTLAGQDVARYRYNAQGQRISKTLASGEVTWYLWQGNVLVAEIAGSGTRRGSISSQYLYLGDSGRDVPVAKLESADAPGNTTGTARTLFIHADYRGEPLAMTDGARHVVWHAQPDAWGYVGADALAGQQAVLNIRLPGQYFDAETGLHDNWHRSYDARPGSPAHGRYLSPDPLGYPNGSDPYTYAGGDPINRMDATGLYERDVHYYMTFFLALAAGLDYDTARTVALADQNVDENPATRPLDASNPIANMFNKTAIRRLLTYHFVLDDSSVGADGLVIPSGYSAPPGSTTVANPTSNQLKRLADSPNNSHVTTACAKDQLFGEYLHSFQDTFAHRDSTNHVYAINEGLGHGLSLSHPDFTYSDDPGYTGGDPIVESRIWAVRPVRTLEMESETYDQLVAFGGGSARLSFDDIKSVLNNFNATVEDEEGHKDGFKGKIDILQAALDPLHIKDKSGNDVMISDPESGGFDVETAKENRFRNLCETAHLKQADLKGTILPSGCGS